MADGTPDAAAKAERVWDIVQDDEGRMDGGICGDCQYNAPRFIFRGRGLCESCAQKRVARWLVYKSEGVPTVGEREIERISADFAFDYAILERVRGEERLRIGRDSR